jgi:hypothetical protein
MYTPDEPLDTLIHEFTHVRHPRLHPGREFTRLRLITYLGRLMGEPWVAQIEKQRKEQAQLHRAIRQLIREERRLNARLLELESRIT